MSARSLSAARATRDAQEVGKAKNKHKSNRDGIGGGHGKEALFSLVEHGGKVRSRHIGDVSAKRLRPILESHIKADAKVYSDDGGSRVAREFPGHASINHSVGECVRRDVYTNTIEGYFSILKARHHWQLSPCEPAALEALPWRI